MMPWVILRINPLRPVRVGPLGLPGPALSGDRPKPPQGPEGHVPQGEPLPPPDHEKRPGGRGLAGDRHPRRILGTERSEPREEKEGGDEEKRVVPSQAEPDRAA